MLTVAWKENEQGKTHYFQTNQKFLNTSTCNNISLEHINHDIELIFFFFFFKYLKTLFG